MWGMLSEGRLGRDRRWVCRRRPLLPAPATRGTSGVPAAAVVGEAWGQGGGVALASGDVRDGVPILTVFGAKGMIRHVMSLVVALEARDGLVLAGDTRGTVGDPRGLTAIRDAHRKIFPLGSHCAVGAVGSAELASSLLDRMNERLAATGHTYIDDVLAFVRSEFRKAFNDWFQQFPVDKRPPVIFSVVGYRKDPTEKLTPLIYLLQSPTDFAPMLCDYGTCLIGVPQYATYLTHRYYDRMMTKENAASLAAYLITETASQDPKVGGRIHIGEITPVAGYRELGEKEIKALVDRNEKQSQQLKKFFFVKTGGGS
jgi:20S proteasome alpha/beta subunit